jgi:hypothetical protein
VPCSIIAPALDGRYCTKWPDHDAGRRGSGENSRLVRPVLPDAFAACLEVSSGVLLQHRSVRRRQA